jgi:hypothetical protein
MMVMNDAARRTAAGDGVARWFAGAQRGDPEAVDGLAGAGYAVACVAVGAAVALPWLRARGVPVSLAGHGNLPVLGAVVISAALFGVTGAGLGALLGSEVITVAGLLLYLYAAEPLVSHVTALGPWTACLPGVAADGLTQASQAGVRLLPPWQGRPGVRRLRRCPRGGRRGHDRPPGHHLTRITR